MLHICRLIHNALAKVSFKNIIFDLGGVLLDLEVSKTFQAFSNLTGTMTGQEIKATLGDSTLFLDYEKGLLPDQVFREEAKKKLALTCSDEEFDKAWNCMLGDIPLDRLEHLLQLKKNFKTFLLSNTNPIHHQFFTKTVQQNTRGQVLDEFFDKAYYSYQLNMSKPDVEIFNHVLKQNNLEASETIFLDDSLANLEGASKAGILVCHISNPKMIFTFFQ